MLGSGRLEYDASGSPETDLGSFLKFDPSEPRDETGKWTDGGGGDAGSADIASTSSHGTTTFHRLTPGGNKRFHDAISAAKDASKFGASVHVYDAKDYRNVKMFMTPDGLAGLAVKNDGDIVSVFKHPDSPEQDYVKSALALGVKNGGNKLDAFDTVLPGLYAKNGFRAVARLKWNDAYAPEGWDKNTFAKFNKGEPDVVFMIHDPGRGVQAYQAGDGAPVATYEEGVAAQKAALDEISKAEGKHPGPGYSASAKIVNGVIHTASVYDAQRALFENRKVDLDQLKSVSTLIKRLGETAAEMAEHGEAAPVFNLCNVSVKGSNLFCADTKGIPRVDMPVIPAKRTKDFIKHLKERGYKVEKGKEQSRNLRATQNEISGAKVSASMKRIKDEGFYKRLVISRDDYIVDGHHTWAGQLALDAKDGDLKDDDRSVKVARVDIPITKLIEEAEKFTGGRGKKPASQAASYRRLSMIEASKLLPPALFRKYYLRANEFFEVNPHLKDALDDIAITVRVSDIRTNTKPLYVHRDLRNLDAFTAWAQAQGFTDIVDDPHVTVLYSKRPVDWDDMGEVDTGTVTVPMGGERSIEQLGDEGAVVLRFESDELSERHDQMVEDGASHDYDSYKPHVTITLSGEIPAGAVPYAGALVFGPEIFETIDKTKDFDPSEPRDEQGRWTDGGGSDGGAGDSSGGASNYGLVPGDKEKFFALKADWARVNNDLLEHIDKPDGPEAQEASRQLESIVKEMHTLRADPGGPLGIGLPGGPRDVVVVGAGPGGLAASINGAAEGLDTLVIEANAVPGGQAKFSSRIENFGGFPVGVTGERLTQDMYKQAQRLGAEAKLGVRVTGMTHDPKTGLKQLTLSNGETIESRTVIMAGGLEFRRLPFPGSEGSGVIVGDGKELAKVGAGGNVCVIGGSNGAAQAALGCARVCDHVYLLARSPVAGSMSDYQVAALRNNPKITVIEGDTIAKLVRDEQGNPKSVETSKGQNVPVKAIGQFLGSVPDTKWVPADVAIKGGKIATNPNYETPIPGVYAVGDMRDGGAGRVGVAYGEGQFALRQANVFLDEQRQQAQGKEKEKAAEPEPSKEKDDTTHELVTRLFVLDRDNPWFGQTAEGVKPPKKKKPS